MSIGYQGHALVSVVIPAHNAEKYIRDAIASVQLQSYRPIEIIVVNDGSTDSTPQIVSELIVGQMKGGLELRMIDIGASKGAANALNAGFRSAKGEYICQLSAEDVWVDGDKIRNQLEAMRRKGAMWSYYRDSLVGPIASQATLKRPYMPGIRWLYSSITKRPTLMFMLLLFRNPVNGSSVMISRECVNTYGQFDPMLTNIDADGDLWMRYSVLGAKLTVLKGAPVLYRRHVRQTPEKREAMVHGGELARMRILKALEMRGKLSRYVRRFWFMFPLVLRPDVYRYRPIVLRFIFFDMMKAHIELPLSLALYFRLYSYWAQRRLRKAKNPIYVDLGRFAEDLDKYSKSETFRDFETKLTTGL